MVSDTIRIKWGYTMKISTKGRYGLTLMISLAKREGQGCVSLKQLLKKIN